MRGNMTNENAMNIMKLDDIARQLIGSDPATLVTINRDGSPQVSLVWVTVQSTADGGDELLTAHLQEHRRSATSGVIPAWR
jgi:hypothetical protein